MLKKIIKSLFLVIKPILYLIYNTDFRLLRSLIYELNTKQEYIFVDTSNEKFIVFTQNCVISRHLFVTKEPTDFDKFDKLSNFIDLGNKIETLVDVGANIGSVCIPACNRNLVTKAIAIEPDPKNYNLLAANVALNDLNKKIKLFDFALGSMEGEILELFLSNKNYGDNRFNTNNIESSDFDEKISVESKQLDSITENLAPDRTLIWMDIQGYEGIVLKGSSRSLDRGFPFVFEFSPQLMKINDSYNILKNNLTKFNYTYFVDLNDNYPQKILLNGESMDALYHKYNLNDNFTDILVIK